MFLFTSFQQLGPDFYVDLLLGLVDSNVSNNYSLLRDEISAC